MKKYIVIFAVLAIFMLSSCESALKHPNQTPPILASTDSQTPVRLEEKAPIINMEDLLSIDLNRNSLRHEKPRVLLMKDIKDKNLIVLIVQLLNRSEIIDKPIYKGRHGYPPTILFHLSNGGEAEIEPAVDCTSKETNVGSETQCNPAKGEIFLHNGSIDTRLASPILYTWLQGEFKEEL